MALILGISGGKKGGRAASFLKQCLQEMKRRRVKVELVELCDYNILPITRIDGDPEHGKSLQSKDDMPALYEKILEADSVVFATPVHWFSVSSEMKIFLDRLTPLENAGFKLEGKIAGFITYGNEEGRMNALMQLSAVANHMGMLIPPYAMIYFDKDQRGWPQKDIKLLAKNIVALIKATKTLDFDY